MTAVEVVTDTSGAELSDTGFRVSCEGATSC